MWRIDPITETGAFDIDFFTSVDYMAVRNQVEHYLRIEGFDYLSKAISIQINNRWWSIWSTDSKPT